MNFMIGFVICDQCEMMAELIIQQGTVKIKLAANIVKDVGWIFFLQQWFLWIIEYNCFYLLILFL